MTCRRVRVRAAFAAACGTFASPAAFAHGGSIPPWVPVLLLISLGGMLACVVVPLMFGSGSMWKRAGIGLAWAVADFIAWQALMYFLFRTDISARLDLPQAVGFAAIGFLAIFPWFLPAALFVAARRGRL